ncbi:MAG: DapH/DapD/GlmU-related protein [Methanomicrobiales archaeon]
MKGIVSAQDPQYTYYAIQSALSQNPEFVLEPFINQISQSAKIHPSAVIASISVAIGKDVVIEKNVIVNEQTIIDEGSIIRSNSTIGNIPLHPGAAMKCPVIQPSGGVHLCRNVDIHANTRIDRAIFKGFTEIGEQTKIDNLNTIGPGTTIGKKCLICGGVSIRESVKIGDDAWIGPNAILENQIMIGNNVYITIGSSVTRDIGNDKVVKDNYALDRKRFRKVIRGM